MNQYKDYVLLNSAIMDTDLYKDKWAYGLFLDLLIGCDPDTNSKVINLRRYAQEKGFSGNTDLLMKKLLKLKKQGYIEVYKVPTPQIKYLYLVALRRHDELYKVYEYETYRDDLETIVEPIKQTRADIGYGRFRAKVMDRDGHCCRICGSTSNLEVHHIKPYAKYPELRTKVSNGITLCKSCHKQRHREMRYGNL